jgi:hypothetical protein
MVSQDWVDRHPLLFGLGVVLFIWPLVSVLISSTGGWGQLGRRFRYPVNFKGPQWSFQSGRMRWVAGYTHCLTLGASDQGLFMSVILPFRIGHPPLLIPWAEIRVEQGTLFPLRAVKFVLGREASIPFWVSVSLADKLKEAAGAAWPIETLG